MGHGWSHAIQVRGANKRDWAVNWQSFIRLFITVDIAWALGLEEEKTVTMLAVPLLPGESPYALVSSSTKWD